MRNGRENTGIAADAGIEGIRYGHFPSPLMIEGNGESGKSHQVNVKAARKSMARMASIFSEIAQHAESSYVTRCPYKDARSRCTAKFACTNQHFTKNPLSQPVCTAKDGDLDYRSAWQI